MSDPPPTPPPLPQPRWWQRLARFKRWAVPALWAVLALVAAVVIWNKMRADTWAYYSDGTGERIEIDDERARPVLWEDPEPHLFESGEANTPSGRLEAAFSADGTRMLLVRWQDGDANADLFLSRWDGRTWSKPEALDSLNTKANERGPALSRDGRYLYFASDRKGGAGGYDLYVARWDGKTWTGVEALPASVNTAANELGPALSPDGSQLFFTSDADGSEDILVSRLTPRKEGKKKPHLPPIPEFASAEAVNSLNSKAAEVEAALTTRGDHVFLASDRARTRKHGFKVYFSRVVDGKTRPPEQVDLYLESGDATDPAVRMEGFDLLFSSNQEGAKDGGDGEGFRLYRSTTREVMGYTDLSRWEQFKELMGDIAWWLLLALVAVIALIYILERWRDISSLFHKCLAGSALVHLVALLLAMLWLIAKEVTEDEKKGEEMVLDMDALAQEELALESVPEETQITETDTQLETQKEESEFGAPGFEPREDAPPVEEQAHTTKEAVVEAQPQISDPTEQPLPAPPKEAPLPNELTATALPEIDFPEMEERAPSEPAPETEPVNEVFEPAPPTTVSNKSRPEEMADVPMESEAEAREVTDAQVRDPAPSPAESAVEVEVSDPVELPPSEQPPLESEMLADLAPEHFVDPTEAPLEEGQPADGQPAADPSQDLFTPGESVPNLTTAPAPSGSASGDQAMEAPADSGAVGAGDLVADTTATESAPAAAHEANASEVPPSAAPAEAPSLPDFALNDPTAPRMEERAPDEEGAPANPADDLFKPGDAAPNLATNPAERGTIKETAMTNRSEAREVEAGSPVTASADLPARPAASESATAKLPTAEPLTPGGLPATALVDPGAPQMEEPAAKPGNPADASRDQFKPGGAPSLTSNKVEGTPATGSAVTKASEVREVGAGARVSEPSDLPTRPAASASATAKLPTAEPLTPGGLPATALVDPGAPQMEEPAAKPGTPADASRDQFKPGGAPSLTTNKVEGTPGAGSAVTKASEVRDVGAGARVAEPTDLATRPAASASQADGKPVTTPLASGGLPAATMVDPGKVTLEEPGRNDAGRADEGKDQFKPGAASALATNQQQTTPGSGTAVSDATAAAAVGKANDAAPEGGAVTGSSLEATSAPLPGGGLITVELGNPGALAGDLLPGKLEAPVKNLTPGEMAKVIQKDRGKPGIDTIKERGGSDGTEKAIKDAIKWLVTVQEEDGRWDTRKFGAKQNYDTGGTGLALLCFYGWGESHKDGKHQKTVRAALDWLLTQQDQEGYLGVRSGNMYSHAISTIALCEAYGMTKDAKLREPAERAIAYSLRAQSKSRGGWRYHPGEDSDLSVTGWQYMALHSARMAGLKVPEDSFVRARKFLDRVGGGKHGGLYGYQRSSSINPAMVATGMFCRQLDLVPPSAARMQESARRLKVNRMRSTGPDLYYVYYATLALYQHQGPIWMDWNERLKDTLPGLQEKTGRYAGSYDPSRGITGEGGRITSTCLATLSLEVYYRLLPMYGFRNEEAEAPEVKVRGKEE